MRRPVYARSADAVKARDAGDATDQAQRAPLARVPHACQKRRTMSKHDQHAKHHAPHAGKTRSGQRRVIALVLVVALGLGWLAWNLLLVESDVAGVAEEAQQAAPPAAN
jgi:hypothetical protein